MSADRRLKSFIDRVLRLKEEQDALAEDIRKVYAEAKAEGYDKTAMGALVSELRRIEKKGADAVSEQSALLDLYREAYERASHTHAYAREASDPATGEITEQQESEIDHDRNEPVTVDSPPAPTGSASDEMPEPFQPPAFLTKPRTAADYRPNCLNPDNCAASGLDHCYACRKVMAEEAA